MNWARALAKKCLRSSQRGQAAIEFAVVISALLVPLLVGMTSLAGFLNNYISLTDAVSTAAQQLASSRGQITDPCALVYTAVTNALPDFATTNLTFTITLNNGNYTKTATSCSGTSTTSPPASYLIQGTAATVKVSYSTGYLLPAYGNFTMNAKTTEMVQ